MFSFSKILWWSMLSHLINRYLARRHILTTVLNQGLQKRKWWDDYIDNPWVVEQKGYDNNIDIEWTPSENRVIIALISHRRLKRKGLMITQKSHGNLKRKHICINIGVAGIIRFSDDVWTSDTIICFSPRGICNIGYSSEVHFWRRPFKIAFAHIISLLSISFGIFTEHVWICCYRTIMLPCLQCPYDKANAMDVVEEQFFVRCDLKFAELLYITAPPGYHFPPVSRPKLIVADKAIIICGLPGRRINRSTDETTYLCTLPDSISHKIWTWVVGIMLFHCGYVICPLLI